MKTNRRIRAWLTTRTWCTFAGLALLGVGEAWMLTHFMSDWNRQTKPVLVQAHPVSVASHPFTLP